MSHRPPSAVVCRPPVIDPSRAWQLLVNWARASEAWWYDLPGRPGMGHYGTGYNHWGLHTTLKYAAVMATLATHPDAPSTVDRQHALHRALAAFRFAIYSHRAHEAGEGIPLTDESRWGLTWISALAIERMMHALPALEPHLTPDEKQAWAQVLKSEADYLLTSYQRGPQPGIQANPWAHSGRNDGESNIWNGCLLWRVATMFPDDAQADQWRERAHQFLINGVSIAADAHDNTIIAGRAVRERFIGANFFDHYAFDHHGYMNVGYMVICHSNAAMLHFDLKAMGQPTPESLYHHQRDLWQATRRLIFSDGRLARIGGDSRVRYAYCQEFLIPTLLMAAECFDEPYAMGLLDAQLTLIEREAQYSGDGSFYGRRLSHLAQTSPYYYTRLESDRAAALSQLLTYLPLTQQTQKQLPLQDPGYESSVAGSWHEPEHGDVVHRSATRLASVCWHAQTITQVMCQPPDDGSLCDWQHNLTGRIRLAGDDDTIPSTISPYRRTLHHVIDTFEGGFVTAGRVREGIDLSLKDGWKGSDLAEHHLAFVALPDGHTLIGLQYAHTLRKRAFALEVRGLGMQLINDFYNHHTRQLFTEQSSRSLQSPSASDTVEPLHSRWVNIDQRIGLAGIYGAEDLTLRRFASPRAGSLAYLRSLQIEEFNWHCQTTTQTFAPQSVMLDVGWAVLSSVDAQATGRFAHQHIEQIIRMDEAVGCALRGMVVRGMDQQRYLILASFGTSDDQHPISSQHIPTGDWQPLGHNASRSAEGFTAPTGHVALWRDAAVR